MGILSLFLKRPPKYKNDLALGDKVIVKDGCTYITPGWRDYLKLPARAKVVRIWGHDIYAVEFLNYPALRGHTFCVMRDALVKVSTDNVVERFIRTFREFDKDGNISKTFLEGYCYYFAVMLCERFKTGTIMYSEKDNHFAAHIGHRLYDITGDISEQARHYAPWSLMKEKDPTHHERIVRDCIRKL